MELSNEDYRYIKQYETTYEKAYKQNYSHILPRSVNEKLNEIIGGEKKNWGCSACCLTLYRKLYTILYNEEARRQREMRERMEKARQAKLNKNNKENNTQEEDGRKTTEPEQLNQ